MKRNTIFALLFIVALALAGYFFFFRKASEPINTQTPTPTSPEKTGTIRPQIPPSEPTIVKPKPNAQSTVTETPIDDLYKHMEKLADCDIVPTGKMPTKAAITKRCSDEDIAILDAAFRCLIENDICKHSKMLAEEERSGRVVDKQLIENSDRIISTCGLFELNDRISDRCKNMADAMSTRRPQRR